MADKKQILLAGEDKHPLGTFTQKCRLWAYLLAETGLCDAEFSAQYTMYVGGKEKPCTYSNVCQVLRTADKFVVYAKDTGTSTFRVWYLPVNPVAEEACEVPVRRVTLF